MKRILFLFLIGIGFALLFRSFCFEVIYIASPSMMPTYAVGDELVVSKISYLFSKPARNDIVMLASPVADKDLIKRVVGLPYEIIEIENKKVYINGELLNETYTQYTRPDTILVGDNIDPFTIPGNHYFVMGDNRDVSRDSRDWSEEEGLQIKTISMDDIKGKVIYSF